MGRWAPSAIPESITNQWADQTKWDYADGVGVLIRGCTHRLPNWWLFTDRPDAEKGRIGMGFAAFYSAFPSARAFGRPAGPLAPPYQAGDFQRGYGPTRRDAELRLWQTPECRHPARGNASSRAHTRSLRGKSSREGRFVQDLRVSMAWS